MITRGARRRRLIYGNTLRRVLGIYSRIHRGNRVIPLSSVVLHGVGQIASALGHRKLHIITITAGCLPTHRKSCRQTSRSSLVLRKCVTFLSPPGRAATPTLGTLGTDKVAMGVLANSDRLITTGIYRRIKLSTKRIIVNDSVRALSSSRLTGLTRHAALFTHLAPVRGRHVIALLGHRKRIINFVNSNVGSTPTLHTTSVNVSISNTMSVTHRTTSVVLLRGDLVILRRKIVRKHHAFTGVLGCVGVATDSGFNGIFDILITDTFLPFLPVLPLRLLVRGLLCSISRITVPFSGISSRRVRGPRH